MLVQDRRQIKNTHNIQSKHSPEKANNAKYSKIKLSWFSSGFPLNWHNENSGLFQHHGNKKNQSRT